MRVRLPIGEPYKALLVPQAALGTDQGRKYLLVVGRDNVVEYRPVTLGPEQPDGFQVVFPEKMVRGDKGLRAAADGDADTSTASRRPTGLSSAACSGCTPACEVEVRDQSSDRP